MTWKSSNCTPPSQSVCSCREKDKDKHMNDITQSPLQQLLAFVFYFKLTLVNAMCYCEAVAADESLVVVEAASHVVVHFEFSV